MIMHRECYVLQQQRTLVNGILLTLLASFLKISSSHESTIKASHH